MKNKTVWSFVALLLFLNCLGLAVAQTRQQAEAPFSTNSCEQFKGIVVEPDKTIDHKMPISKPNDTVDHKGIVINPCEKKMMVRLKPLPIKPRLNQIGQSPTSDSKNQSADNRVKPITEMVNSSEMLKRARQAKEQGK